MIPGTIIDVDSESIAQCLFLARRVFHDSVRQPCHVRTYKQTDRSCQIQNCCPFVGNLRALNDTVLVFKNASLETAIEETESLAHRNDCAQKTEQEKSLIPYKSLLLITTTSNKSLLQNEDFYSFGQFWSLPAVQTSGSPRTLLHPVGVSHKSVLQLQQQHLFEFWRMRHASRLRR